VEEQRLRTPANDVAAAVENLLDHYETRGGRAMRSSNLSLEGPLADLGHLAREIHYEWVDHVFSGWLTATKPPQRARLRAALIVVCDVQSWWILSHDLGLPRPEVRDTLVVAINHLLGEGS
jgi:hypothetical protein